jgi:hypothetical protein
MEELVMNDEALKRSKKEIRKQQKATNYLLRKEFGLLGFIRIILRAMKHFKRINTKYPEAIKKTKEIRPQMAENLTKLGALFFAIADNKGRKYANDFITNLIQKNELVFLPNTFPLNRLPNGKGDSFDDLKKHCRALFAKANQIGIWKNKVTNETDNLLEFKITTCAMVEFFKGIECTDLITIGCDYGLSQYPYVEEIAQCDFKRSCTLAKGGAYCHIQFYKKGTAPKSIIK